MVKWNLISANITFINGSQDYLWKKSLIPRDFSRSPRSEFTYVYIRKRAYVVSFDSRRKFAHVMCLASRSSDGNIRWTVSLSLSRSLAVSWFTTTCSLLARRLALLYSYKTGRSLLIAPIIRVNRHGWLSEIRCNRAGKCSARSLSRVRYTVGILPRGNYRWPANGPPPYGPSAAAAAALVQHQRITRSRAMLPRRWIELIPQDEKSRALTSLLQSAYFGELFAVWKEHLRFAYLLEPREISTFL